MSYSSGVVRHRRTPWAMAELIEAETRRLRLRQWKAADREPFAALNSDPRVMEFFPSPLTRTESDAMADRMTLHVVLPRQRHLEFA